MHCGCMVAVVGGFPMYIGDPETYMHLRRSELMTAATDEKNAVTVLNELYYESAVYKIIENENSPSGSCLVNVTVDGITTYGRGSSRKEAKVSAACAAIQQLRCLGILQKRITEKESVQAKRMAATKASASDKPVPYRHTVCPVVPENAIAKLNHLHPGLNYNVVDAHLETGQTSYTVRVNVNGQDFTGTGRSKKTARLAAAESALKAFNKWTVEDDFAKKQAQTSAATAGKLTMSSANSRASGRPLSRGPRVRGLQRGFRNMGNIRSNQFARARGRGFARGGGVASSRTIQGAGSFLDNQILHFTPTSYGLTRGLSLRARGSGMLRRGTRGGGFGARGAASKVVGHTEIPPDKNPVMMLNEIYYSAAVYDYPSGGEVQMDQSCTVTVDGITAYGTGPTRKDAKLNAASSAVQQLQACGILQQRLADKAEFMSQKHALLARKKRGAVPVQASARMHRGYPAPGNVGVTRGQGSRGRGAVRGRGVARGRGVSRGNVVARGRGSPAVMSWYPQNASMGQSVDFTTLEDASFMSFEDTVPKRETAAASQYQHPGMPIGGQQPGQMLNYWS